MPWDNERSGVVREPAPKAYAGEQHKARPPAETVAWARERFQGLGPEVLKKTKRIDSGRLDIPVYISLCGPTASRLMATYKQMGKGASPAQAEASALMELAERYSFFTFVTAPRPLARPGELNGPAVPFAHIARSLHHPEPDLERARRVYELLPQRWVWARELASGEERLLPLDWFYAINEYNGPAAGNRQAEAVVQALCEVVERHVSAVVTNENAPTPAIDPASVTDPVARGLLAKYAAAGIEVALKDFTLGMGVASVAALCWDPASLGEASELVYTAGTATSPAQALIRALTEVAQLAGDFESGSSYLVSALPKFADPQAAAAVLEPAGTVSLNELPSVEADDFAREVELIAAALGERGYPAYAMDTTHPQLAIPAVYTVVPGAHFAHRTIGTDCVFHAAKLASQLDDAALAGRVLGEMARVASGAYFLPFFQGLALINQEEPARALELLDQALTLSPPPQDEASIHTQRGVALKDMGRFGEAQAALARAAVFPEPHAEVFNLLGFCHFKLEQYEDAVAAFMRAVELDPGQAINYANLGVNLARLGRDEEAVQAFGDALDLDPALDWARAKLAELEGGG